MPRPTLHQAVPTRWLITASALLWLVACPAATAEKPALTLLAAASTTEVFTELAARHSALSSVEVRSSFASSATLARQIEAGAHADLFVSANPRWMDRLAQLGLLQPDSRRDLLSNSLVLVVPDTRTDHLALEPGADLSGFCPQHIALGDPDHVPAGQYAREALQQLGLWQAVQPRLVPGLDVRDALRKVELGAVDCAVVYATDAAASERVRIAGRFPAGSHAAIRYPVALLRDARPQADALLETLLGPEAQAVYRQAGFGFIDASPR